MKVICTKFLCLQTALLFLFSISFAMDNFTKTQVGEIERSNKELSLEDQNKLARYYLLHKDINMNKDLPRKAFEILFSAAKTGFGKAQCNLGLCYLWGWGTEKNRKKAFELFEKSSDKGIYEADSNLGLCYEHGWGVSKNLKKAIEYYQKAADLGIKQAQEKLKKLLYKNSSKPNKPKVVLTFPAFD